MKRKFLILGLGIVLVGCGGYVTKTPQTQITIPLSCSGNCGQIQIYRIIGQCPSVLAGSSGWTVFTATNNSKFVDATVSSGTTYSYVGEGILNGAYSGPSNCITRTAL